MARAQVVFGERKKWKIWGLCWRRVKQTVTDCVQGGKENEESGKSPKFLAGAMGLGGFQ